MRRKVLEPSRPDGRIAAFIGNDFIRSADPHSAYALVTVRFVLLQPDGAVRNLSGGEELGEYDDLVLSGQWSTDKPDPHVYAWEARYLSVYSLELERAERAVRMLRRIRRAEKLFPVQPSSFGQYVKLVLDALGILVLVEGVGGSSTYAELRLRCYEGRDIGARIDQRIQTVMDAKGQNSE